MLRKWGEGGGEGLQAETTIYFEVWWVLFEYTAVVLSFGHFPNSSLKDDLLQSRDLNVNQNVISLLWYGTVVSRVDSFICGLIGFFGGFHFAPRGFLKVL